MNPKSVVCCAGSGPWFTNIGTAFFNIGVKHVLRQVLPEASISFIGDHPGWYWKKARSSGIPAVLIDDLSCDYFVISGPQFDELFPTVWGETLLRLKASGTRILLISAGSMEYSGKELEKCRSLLDDIQPYLIMSRDSETYRRYADMAEHSYDGICFAFFCSDYLTDRVKIESEDIIINFDKGLDYNVIEVYGEALLRLLAEGTWIQSEDQNRLKRTRSASRMSTFANLRIVRTYHSAHPPLWRKLLKSVVINYSPFRRPNCYVSDIPEGYLHLYRHARLTISERVHACVPAVAFGNYAWLISTTERARLFSRVGLDDITRRPVRADLSALAEEKRAIVSCLKEIL